MYNPFIEIENNTINNCNSWFYTFGDDNSFMTNEYHPNLNHQYFSDGDFLITQVVANNFGCIDSLSIPIKITPIKTLYVPNSFTPDNDGINDFFFPKGLNITPFKLEVFNRWGIIIFTSIDIKNSWDGTYKGKGCISDVYIYKITYGSEEYSHIKTGNVTLIR